MQLFGSVLPLCSKLDKVKVAVPNDTTNEARALTLLEKNGFFKLKADAGLTATKNDIEENPLNVTVDEVEAAQVPNVLQDEDYAVINSNYAISAGLDPMTDALAIGTALLLTSTFWSARTAIRRSPRSRLGRCSARASRSRTSWMRNTRALSVLVVENPTDGYDASVDYDALNGETVSCAATAAPHCEVLEVLQGRSWPPRASRWPPSRSTDDYVIPHNLVRRRDESGKTPPNLPSISVSG